MVSKPESQRLDFREDDLAITESLNPIERRRMFILGAIEFIPVVISIIVAEYLASMEWRLFAVMLGLVTCIFVCWLLRKKTPLTRIYGRNGGSEDCR